MFGSRSVPPAIGIAAGPEGSVYSGGSGRPYLVEGVGEGEVKWSLPDAHTDFIIAVAAEDWPAGGKALSQIRMLVGINTIIGLITIAIASGGRYLVS